MAWEVDYQNHYYLVCSRSYSLQQTFSDCWCYNILVLKTIVFQMLHWSMKNYLWGFPSSTNLIYNTILIAKYTHDIEAFSYSYNNHLTWNLNLNVNVINIPRYEFWYVLQKCSLKYLAFSYLATAYTIVIVVFSFIHV